MVGFEDWTILYENSSMMGILHKNLIHPSSFNTTKGNSTTTPLGESLEKVKDETHSYSVGDAVIPISSFDEDDGDSPRKSGWINLLMQRHLRNPEVPWENETWKYEVTDKKSGNLLYHVTEKTEFFVKDTGCLLKPCTKEFVIFSTTTNENIQEIKLIAEYGRTGFCKKITAYTPTNRRPLATISRKYSLIPNSFKYLIEINGHFPTTTATPALASNNIINLQSKYSFKSNILCFHETQEFLVTFGNGKDRRNRRCLIPQGNISRDTNTSSTGFKLSLFLSEEQRLERFLVVAATLLIDLQTRPDERNSKGLIQFDVGSCLIQLIASVIFYFIILMFIVSVVFILFL